MGVSEGLRPCEGRGFRPVRSEGASGRKPLIDHHGAVDGVTGSCHELAVAPWACVLIDCDLFQGEERSAGGAGVGKRERPPFFIMFNMHFIATICS